MRILQVITSLLTGGAETLVVNLVPKLRAMGNEVDVCVFNGVETPLTERLRKENPGIRIYKLGTGYYNPFYIAKLAKLMRQYDIVHTHNSSPQLYVAIASLFRNVKLCTTEHTTSNRKREWKWYAPIESWMYGRYDHIICISDIAEKKLREYMGGEWLDANSNKFGKISTINNGVDVEKIHSAEPLPESEANRKGKFIVTMVAGFRDAKDQDTLVRAMQQLPEEYELWLVGAGERMGIVKQLADSLGLGGRVRFWGLRQDVPRIIKTSDVVVMSSHWEGLSLSNIEGLSAGKPFVASDVNGLREVTKGYGILFQHGDATELASILKHLHDDTMFYQSVASRCFERACNYDISKTVAGYEAIYKSIMK